MIRFLIMVMLANVGLALPARAATTETVYQTFADLRGAVLDVISGATKRIWVVSEYLTDGEIVSALYLAQYRKLDVQVLLGRAKASHYMSRLNYLKNQNIPVFLRPDSFKVGAPSAVLADDVLLYIDSELDSLARLRRHTVRKATAENLASFQTAFASAANLKVPAIPRPRPLVGRPNPNSRIYQPEAERTTSADGAYIYGRKSEPRPEGVPGKLPKNVKWSERKPMRAGPVPDEPAASAPPALPAEGD